MQPWEEFLQAQKKELGEKTFQQWLSPVRVITFDACNLYLEVDNHFQLLWFEEHIRPKIQHALYNKNYHLVKVHIKVATTKTTKKNAPKEEALFFKMLPDFIDKNATLSSFYTLEKNALSFQLFCELLGYDLNKNQYTTSKTSFNPLFLHGPSGVGKTHLLMAATDILKKQKKNVFFVKAATFTNHVVNAIRLGSIKKFRDTYRHVEVLIIDDVHVFSGKIATQEEFFHTFNTLHSKESQIILSANCPPNQLQQIESRLISRFEWGLMLKFEKAEKEALRTIFIKKANALSLHFNEDALSFLLRIFPSPLEIQKALEAIVLRIKKQKNIELSDLQYYLSDLIAEQQKIRLDHEKIISNVATYFGIKITDILGKSQTKECSFPRQLAMYFCRKKLQMTYKSIGNLFQRDHSTVITSIKYIQKKKEEKNKDVCSSLLEIVKLCDRYL